MKLSFFSFFNFLTKLNESLLFFLHINKSESQTLSFTKLFTNSYNICLHIQFPSISCTLLSLWFMKKKKRMNFLFFTSFYDKQFIFLYFLRSSLPLTFFFVVQIFQKKKENLMKKKIIFIFVRSFLFFLFRKKKYSQKKLDSEKFCHIRQVTHVRK